MAGSAGQIGLDLVINQKQYNKQLSGITSMAKKAGAVIAAAFSVKKIVDFGKECIELGSDLAEVQNVVDVTFPSMSARVDKFAQSAMTAYGLSETMAKKFTGTFGAMAKAFGFTEEQAYGMSTTLTGLAGDVASFYNISQDEAYVKLKSVFTGETESLKDLGVVMTQTALDSFAMAKGFGKTTAKMKEAEKVALRYAFVQDQLATATGDFARTSDGWANQVRVLKLQFDSLKATTGQGLINAFTPVLKVINTLLSKLNALAKKTQAFFKFLSGKNGNSTEAGFNNVAGAADSVAESTSGIGDAASEAAEKMAALMGFDKISKLSEPSTSGSSGSSDSAADFGTLDIGNTALEVANKECDELSDKLKNLATRFKNGIQIGLKTEAQENLKNNISDLKKSIKNIWDNEDLVKAREDFETQSAETFGVILGSAESIGISIADGIIAGMSGAAEDEEFQESVKDNVTGTYENLTEAQKAVREFSEAMAVIAKAFESDAFKGISEFFTKWNMFWASDSLDSFTGFVADVAKCFSKPVADNAEKLKGVLEKIFAIVNRVLEPAKKLLDTIMANDEKYKDSPMHKFMEDIAEGNSKGLSSAIDGINVFLDGIAAMIAYTEKLPETFQVAKEGICAAFAKIGDWFSQKWKEIKRPFEIASIWFTASFQGAKDGICAVFGDIGGWFSQKWSNIKNIFSGVGTWFGNRFSEAKEKICSVFSGIPEFFKDLWRKIISSFTDVGTKIGNAVGGAFKSAMNKVFSTIEGIVNGFLKAINAAIGVINKIPGVNIKKVGMVSLPRLAQGGYVKPNTPQLAMIGDNRHQGEVVAPEDKLKEMAMQAVKAAGNGIGITKDELERIINNAVLRIVAALYELGFNLDGEQLAKAEKIVKQGMDRRFNVAEVLG